MTLQTGTKNDDKPETLPLRNHRCIYPWKSLAKKGDWFIWDNIKKRNSIATGAKRRNLDVMIRETTDNKLLITRV